MVRLNNKTWVTTTTYGAVFTHISKKNQLHRIYIDDEASKTLCQDNFQSVINEIKKKHIPLDDFSKKQEKYCQELNTCRKIAKKQEWKLFSLTPLQFSLQTVNYCNANCDFCYANAPNTSKRKKMNLQRIYQLKDYAAKHGVKFGVSGGEPLLHPSIYDILKYRQKEVFDTLITNLTPSFDIEKIIKTNVDLIQVSLHGYQKIHDDTIKIKGAYDKILDRMKTLLPHVNMATNTVITPENMDSIPNLVKDLHRLQQKSSKNLTYIRFVPVVPSGTGISKYKVKEKFFDNVEKLLRSLEKKYSDINFEIPMIHANPYEYKKINDRWMCPAGSTVAVVKVDGHIVPCNQFLDTDIKSKKTLSQTDFQHIWQNDQLFSHLRKGIAATKQKNCEECMYLLMKKQKKLSK